MKIIDVIGVVLIVLGISMTVLNFLAARREALHEPEDDELR